jgi:peroxiredoxin
LHDLLEQGARAAGVRADRRGPAARSSATAEALLGAGVVPVAIVHARDADAWKLVQRYRLTYSLLSDPRADLASSYGVADAG